MVHIFCIRRLLKEQYTYRHFLNILNMEDFFVEGGPIIIGTWFLWVTEIWKTKRVKLNINTLIFMISDAIFTLYFICHIKCNFNVIP